MTTERVAYEHFLHIVQADFLTFLDQVCFNEIEQAAHLILAAQEQGNRLHISGIGKPAHIAGYVASLLSSTGTPTYFLHGTEAVHGSCGQLVPGYEACMAPGSVYLAISTGEQRTFANILLTIGCA